MHWEGLNERLEEAYRSGALQFYGDDKIYDNLDYIIVDRYIEFLEENYSDIEKESTR